MSKLRILIADDDPIIRLDLKQMLVNLEYEVVGEAGNGEEAVSIAREKMPDICILDIKMPRKDGIAAVTEIVGEDISPCILLTAYSDRDLVERATGAGAFAYLVKPFKPNDLPPAIEVAVARFAQYKQLRLEITDLQERMETRKLLDRAKGVLMDRHGLSEMEAYRKIQQSSMNARKTMKEVAEAILLAETVDSQEIV